MCKFLICHDMLRSECQLLLNINFVIFGKGCKRAITFFINLENYILIYMTKLKKKKIDKINENLKYLNDVGNLLQIFVGKDITSNLATNVKFFVEIENKRNVMREEINYFSQQTYISLDC